MKNADKAAMPQLHTIDGNWVKEPIEEYAGLTKREYFAAKAMQGIMANNRAKPTKQEHFDNIAEDAVRSADALIRALANEA
jgi:hypothetical protein